MRHKRWLRRLFGMEFALLGVLLLVMALFSILNGKAFYQVYNLMNILKAAGSIAIMVLGLTWVIGMSEMDASFPEVASCASMLFAVMLNARVDPMLAAGLCLLAGVGFGLLTSLLVVKLQFHSLITTIATSTIAGAGKNRGQGPPPVPVLVRIRWRAPRGCRSGCSRSAPD